MKFTRIYILHFFLLGIMGIAYSMPVGMNNDDKRIKEIQDRKLGSSKEQKGNSDKSVMPRMPKRDDIMYAPSYDYIRKAPSKYPARASHSSGSASNR